MGIKHYSSGCAFHKGIDDNTSQKKKNNWSQLHSFQSTPVEENQALIIDPCLAHDYQCLWWQRMKPQLPPRKEVMSISVKRRTYKGLK